MNLKIAFSSAVFLFTFQAFAAEDLKWGADSEYHDGIPKGKIEKQPALASKLFPGTTRDWWIYVPAQYDGNTPAAIMFFQDGGGPLSEKGEMRAPVVFDNLIASKEMPVTIGVFINPGVLPPSEPVELEGGKKRASRQNRAFEYDSIGDRYARFLIEEIMPEVEKKYKIDKDPALHAICGQSSGGSCAFTAAWERPDYFGKVVSGIGSFTSLHGCNAYPDFIRKMEPKPIRVFLQDGDHDLDIYAGSWWHANMDMAAALRWMGYDYKFLQGTGGHSGKQLGTSFPEVMRWLWRKDPVKGERPKGADPRGVFEVLIPGEDWKKASSEEAVTVASDAKGTLYLSRNGDIRTLKSDGTSAAFAQLPRAKVKAPDGNTPFYASGETEGLQFLPDGKLLASCSLGLIQLSDDGKDTPLAAKTGILPTGFAVGHDSAIYFSQDGTLKLLHGAEKKDFSEPQKSFDRLIFSPDQGFLVGYNPSDFTLRSWRIEKDKSLSNEEPFYTLLQLEGQIESQARSAVFDDKGRLYVSSINGIQIFDQGGRVIGILTLPERNLVNGITFGGEKFDTLYAATDKGIYARKLNVKGVRSCDAPVAPPPPRM